MILPGVRPWFWLALPALTACAGLPHADPVPQDAAGGYAEWRWPEGKAGRNWADGAGHPDRVPDSFRTAQIRLQHLQLGCAKDWMPGLIRLAQRQYHKALRAFAARFYEDAFVDLTSLNRQLDDIERRLRAMDGECGHHERPCAESGSSGQAALRTQFAYNSAEILPAARAELRHFAQRHGGKKALRLQVFGHASAEGSTEHNEALARRRAEAVADILLEAGLSQQAIEITSFGARQPLDSNATAAGRVLNRRVEIHVTPANSTTRTPHDPVPERENACMAITAPH